MNNQKLNSKDSKELLLMPKDKLDDFYAEMDPDKKKTMSVSEIIYKLDYVYKMVND